MNNNNENEYYKRQIILREVGNAGQKKLKNTRILVIGAGGLGSPLLTYIAAAGVGSITIYDFDIVNESNLHRQILFSPEDIGQNKAIVAAKKLSIQNPYIEIHGFATKFNSKVKIDNFDIIIDCSDNFTTKFLAHDLAFKYKKIFSVASIHKFEGQIQIFNFQDKDRATNCMRCLWANKPSNDCVETCEQAGVIGAVAGVLGTVQAMEVIKTILGLNTLLNEQNLIINLLDFTSIKLKISKNTNCPLCSHQKDTIDDFILSSSVESLNEYEITLQSAMKDKYKIINISNSHLKIKTNLTTTLDAILLDLNKNSNIDPTEKIAIICNKGITSTIATKLLRQNGYLNSFSINGGIELNNLRKK